MSFVSPRAPIERPTWALVGHPRDSRLQVGHLLRDVTVQLSYFELPYKDVLFVPSAARYFRTKQTTSVVSAGLHITNTGTGDIFSASNPSELY